VKRTKQQGNTLAKHIEAQLGTHKATEVALYGHAFSPIERDAHQFMFAKWGAMSCAKAGQSEDNPDRHGFTQAATECAGRLAQAMLDAATRGDGNALRTVAKVVETWKPSSPQAHPQWAHVLTLKEILDERNERMQVSELAKLLNYPKTDDGFSALRRLAHRLKFPIAPAKPGAPRKIQTRKQISRA
jgi:hypothetical protein